MNQEEFFKRYTYSPSRDRIGGGGFGTVYKAYDEVLHREVAIKVSEVKTTADGKKTFSLKDEFEALNHVPKHPNIANYEEFYSFEMPNGIFDYAVMQYYPDGNLSNAIKQSLTEDQKEDVATQLLEGIDFLHKHKVVHRDLKPGNILIVKHGGRIIPLITDFGLSKAAGVVDGSVFSNSFGAGTPRYSSPEQLQGNPLRLNTDLWSYGAILYELFTGEQLFSAGSGAANTAQADMEIYNKIVNGNVQSLGKMPEKWRKVAERCLVVDATKRAKDATELFAIIKSNAPDDDETEITEGPEIQDLPSSAPKDVPVSPQGNKKGLWIGLCIAVAAVVVLLFLFRPKDDSEPHILLLDEQFVLDSTRVADSIAKAQEALAQAEAQKKEDEAYANCTTIKECDIYLKAYPKGRYVEEVKSKKTKLEEREMGQHKPLKEETLEQEVYEIVEEMPSFPGGEKKMYEYLSKNIKYPQIARESGIQGKVFINFIIDSNGRVTNVTLLRGIGGGCDEEAIRVVKSMPKWKPGKQRGTPVKVRYTLPIIFRLDGGEQSTNEPVEADPLQPLPAPNGRPDLIYYFKRGGASLDGNKSKSQDALLKEVLGTYNVKGFRIYGWASPDEQDYSMPDNYAKSVESHIKSIIKQSDKNVNSYSFETKGYGPDWNTFIEAIQNSDISNRDYIVNEIIGSANKERTIREMIAQYPQLEKDVLPSMRRVEVFLY